MSSEQDLSFTKDSEDWSIWENPYDRASGEYHEPSIRPEPARTPDAPEYDHYDSASGEYHEPSIRPEPAHYSGKSYNLVSAANIKDAAAKPRGRRWSGLVAGMLAAGVIGGASGGGGAAWWILSRQAENAPVAETASPVTDLAGETGTGAADVTSVTALNAPAPAVLGDVTSIVEKAGVSVVEIALSGAVMSFFGMQEVESAGSGVIISSNGYIVTNNHVVEQSDKITVRTQDGTEYEAKLIGTDAKTDLAVIKVEADGLVPAVFADSSKVHVGQVAVAIGNPLGTLGGTVTNGIVSAKDREITIDNHTMTLLQTSAAVNPGNSGGGLFDAEGALIGVVNAKSGGLNVEGLGFAIPSNLVRQAADDLIEKGYVTGRPELGVKILEINDSRAAAYYGVRGIGVYVMETTRENGLKPGDRLINIDGIRILAASNVSEAVSKSKVDSVMRVVLERDGETLELDVTVGEQIPDSVKASFPKPTGI